MGGRTLLYGGVAMNPRSHLRLVYEANPLAFITEQVPAFPCLIERRLGSLAQAFRRAVWAFMPSACCMGIYDREVPNNDQFDKPLHGCRLCFANDGRPLAGAMLVQLCAQKTCVDFGSPVKPSS